MNFELQSAETKDIAAALAKAQGSIENALKDSKNPHFKSSFASLAAVINATNPELSKNGISAWQATVPHEGQMMVVTTLHHASGQWIRSYTPLILSKQDMQGLGSAITYARRYALSAIVGITQEDDDGQAAVHAKAPPPALQPRPAAIERAPTPKAHPKDTETAPHKPTASFDGPAMQSVSDYVVKAGKKYVGQKLKDIPINELESFRTWIATKADQRFRESVEAKEFMFFSEQYLKRKVAEGDDLDVALSRAVAKDDGPGEEWMKEGFE